MEVDHMMERLTIQRPPPIRVFAIDDFGLIRVIDSKRNEILEIVDTWGDENSSPVVAVSLANRDDDPLLAIARKNFVISVLNPRDGSQVFEIESDFNDPIIGLHLFDSNTIEPNSSRSCKLVTCTEKGQTGISSYTLNGQCLEGSNMKWSAPKEMRALFSKFYETKNLSIFGGMNGALHLCDHETGQISWTAEPIDVWPKDISFVAGSFVEDGKQWVAGSDIDNVSIFDIRHQKPVQTFDLYLEKPGKVGSSIIQSIAGDSNSKMVHIGTDSGDLFSLDLSTGRRHDFEAIGYNSLRHTSLYSDYPRVAPSGPIRDMNMHHDHPLIASAGDYCLDIWNTDNRRLMAKVDMDENLSHILFDYTSLNEAD